jgi:hypothetical protein
MMKIILMTATLVLAASGCSIKQERLNEVMVESCKVGCTVSSEDLKEESVEIQETDRQRLREKCETACERLPYLVRSRMGK